jgi:hypothetical protein
MVRRSNYDAGEATLSCQSLPALFNQDANLDTPCRGVGGLCAVVDEVDTVNDGSCKQEYTARELCLCVCMCVHVLVYSM